MRNKQRKLETTISVSELILSAVYFLQKKNGVTAKDITKYICAKRGFKQSQMRNKVKQALERGIRNGIFNLKRGLYKVEEDCKKKLTNLRKKVKKKNETNKASKKIQKKAEESKSEEKRVMLLRETPKMSIEFAARTGSRTLSEDIFDRRGRENSYFEPSALARPSDEELDDFDDDDYDNEDESSESDEKDNLDIFTITFGEEASHEKFPELNIYTAARQPRRKEISEKGRERNKCSIRGRAKKRKISKSQKKKRRENEKAKTKRPETDDDDENDDKQNQHNHDDENCFDEDESEFTEEINNHECKNKTSEGRTQSDQTKRSSDQKEIKDTKEVKDIKTNGRQKGKLSQGARKSKRTKRESSEENPIEENEMKIEGMREKSLSKSNCLISSSTKLFHSDLKLSTSPNMTVSDVKFSPTNMKFEARKSSMLFISDGVKNEPTDQSVKDEDFLEDFEILCECRSPKRHHLSHSHCCHSAKFAESIQDQSNTEWSK